MKEKENQDIKKEEDIEDKYGYPDDMARPSDKPWKDDRDYSGWNAVRAYYGNPNNFKK